MDKELKTTFAQKYQLILFGCIIAASIISSVFIASAIFANIRTSDNVISVSGSAKQKVQADSARWTGRFTRTAFQTALASGYADMKKDEQVIRAYFKEQGVDVFEISPVFMSEVYKNDQNAPKEYNLSQDIEVKLDDPQKLKEIAKNSEILVSRGVLFQPNPVEYYYSKLPELRVSLLPEAIKDARARAQSIASSSNNVIDTVRSVTMGVVQVLSEGSIEVSDYGAYDTSKIDKEVMITVKATFGLK
jgi:uncharacterized protein